MLALRSRLLRRISFWAALMIGLHLAPAAWADQSGAATGDAQRFRSVSGPERENAPGVPLLLAAYALFWICVSCYVLRLARLQHRLRERSERLDRSAKPAPVANA